MIAKLRATAEAGLFNTFMGEFNFADLPEADLLRSIRLFGEKVTPALRATSRSDAALRYCAFASSGFALMRAVFRIWTAKQTIAPAANGSADQT